MVNNVAKNICKKIKGFKLNQIISITLWVITAILLLLIVIIASSKTLFPKYVYSDTIASVVLIFAIFLISSLLYIVFYKYLEKRKV